MKLRFLSLFTSFANLNRKMRNYKVWIMIHSSFRSEVKIFISFLPPLQTWHTCSQSLVPLQSWSAFSEACLLSPVIHYFSFTLIIIIIIILLFILFISCVFLFCFLVANVRCFPILALSLNSGMIPVLDFSDKWFLFWLFQISVSLPHHHSSKEPTDCWGLKNDHNDQSKYDVWKVAHHYNNQANYYVWKVVPIITMIKQSMMFERQSPREVISH